MRSALEGRPLCRPIFLGAGQRQSLQGRALSKSSTALRMATALRSGLSKPPKRAVWKAPLLVSRPAELRLQEMG
jgi:hypothetical protein